MPRRKRLRVGASKADAYTPDSKLEGLDEAYIEDNKALCGILRVESDHVLSRYSIGAVCRSAGVPLPNIIVGWRDASGNSHRPHLLWLLHDSVPLRGANCQRFLSLYRGVLRGLTLALLPIGADPGGLLNSHSHKNPLCPDWHREVIAQQPYDLSAIKRCVDVTVRMADLEGRAARAVDTLAAPGADHPDPVIASASNSVFRGLAMWARTEVGRLRAAGLGEADFAAHVARQGQTITTGMTGDAIRSESGILRLAAKVSHWTWNVYRSAAQELPKLSTDELHTVRAACGRKVSDARRDASFEKIGWVVSKIIATGQKPKQAAVLGLVRPYGITSLKTVSRHWKAVRLAVAANRAFSQPSRPWIETSPAGASTFPVVPAFLFPGTTPPRPLPAVPAFLRRDAGDGANRQHECTTGSPTVR